MARGWRIDEEEGNDTFRLQVGREGYPYHAVVTDIPYSVAIHLGEALVCLEDRTRESTLSNVRSVLGIKE